MRLNGRGEFGRLSGEQIGRFRRVLLDAFPTVAALDELFTVYLNRNREAVALGDNLRELLLKVILQAEADSWTAELLAAARTAQPGNEALLVFAQGFGLAPAIPESRELERKIKDTGGTLDPVPWRTRMGLIEGQVCRVEVDSGRPPEFGTGFLVGPGVVMTNYHVIESLLRPKYPVPSRKVVLRFDFKALADGAEVGAGTTYSLAEGDWLLDSSPWSPYDERYGSGVPAPDELDYALLAVNGTPGDDPVGGPNLVLSKPEPRGWIEMPSREHEFKANDTVWIMQHPDGGPLKFAMDTESVIGLNSNGTRVRYKTTTEPGSSGSPCFDSNWNLIALHHSGDPRYPDLGKAEYNEGIPLTAILALMNQRNTRSLLGRPR